MKELTLTKQEADSLVIKLENAGYEKYERKKYHRFSKGRADSTYIHYSLNIIRSTVNTEAELIIKKIFGDPNGKASDSEDSRYSSWFFNGYVGKNGSIVY
ncbi:MAG: hypothetical protein HOI31_01810 [Gammaproteobacteria bacterium]|jgi:hypothetical protein|nr:hypothetical protein [Candidatus Neomarinimicrobiota bacterium]MBT5271611.1 hypothetical protein [Candidatus Neomarinimicrobiota bacterium]MBT5745010.1 hypothetical protein [Gammaproteobacteria bacterium]